MYRFVGYHVLVLLVIPILYYYKERFNVINFIKSYKQQQYLQGIYELIDNYITSSIIIVQNKQIISKDNTNIQQLTYKFANKQANNQFNIQNNQQNNLQEKINLTDLQIQNGDKFQNDNQEANLLEIINQNLNKFEQQLKGLQLIENVGDKQQPLKLNNNEVYLDCLTNELDEKKQQYYFVKIINCIWENTPSFMIIIDNVSEKVKNKKLVESKNKDLFLASVTHDLKTPLNSIISISQTAQQTIEKSSEEQTYLDVILTNAKLMNFLVCDIQDYSQYRNNKFKLVLTQFNINIVANELIQLFSLQMKSKNLQFIISNKLSIQQSLIYNDQIRLKQVLINLVSNALKFTLQGYIKIKIKPYTQDKNIICIIVKDTGAGIPQNIQNNLFKIFGAYDHYQGTNKHGVGLGLNICKKLVKQLGPFSKITVKSILNKGTKFIFYIYRTNANKQDIPLQFNDQNINDSIASENINIKQYSQQDLIQVNLKKNKFVTQQQPIDVLIVDDNPFNIFTLQKLLQKYHQFKIESSFNGEDALQKINCRIEKLKKNYDLIFMDINMPIMDGIETTKYIRHLEKENNLLSSQIIIISTFDKYEEEMCKKAGSNINVNKPISNDNLLSILHDLKFIR